MFGGSTEAVVEFMCQLTQTRTAGCKPRLLDIGPGFGQLGERLFERFVLDLSE